MSIISFELTRELPSFSYQVLTCMYLVNDIYVTAFASYIHVYIMLARGLSMDGLGINKHNGLGRREGM